MAVIPPSPGRESVVDIATGMNSMTVESWRTPRTKARIEHDNMIEI